jgi:hypothetical protein
MNGMQYESSLAFNSIAKIGMFSPLIPHFLELICVHNPLQARQELHLWYVCNFSTCYSNSQIIGKFEAAQTFDN